MTDELIAGIGTTEADIVLDLGAHHPSADGALRLALTLDGDTVLAAEPLIGHLHRGAEKLFESRDYRQIIMLADRHDWLSAFCGEVGVCLAVESLLGLQVPPRATWLRTILAELTRIGSHLAFMSRLPAEIAGQEPTHDGLLAREAVQRVVEVISGGRMHPMFCRIGGVIADAPAGWTEQVRAALDEVERLMPAPARIIEDDDDFAAATVGIGVLRAKDARAYGVSGPMARASGVDLDLRRDAPSLAYAELADVLRVCTDSAGDVLSRFRLLPAEIRVSIALVRTALDRLPGGDVNVRLPKSVRAPEGHIYVATENPPGMNGYYLVSRAERTPWRLKLRTASFSNISSLPALLPGNRITDLVAILGSAFFTVGDIDR